MPGDREVVVGVAGSADQPEAVARETNRSCQTTLSPPCGQKNAPLPMSNLDNRQLRSRISKPAAQAVDECRVGGPADPFRIEINIRYHDVQDKTHGTIARAGTNGAGIWYQSASVMMVFSVAQ